jgi:Zn-dependent protease with chaperone function
VPAPAYVPYCLALRALARRRLERRGDAAGVPVYALAEGGVHDAIGIGWGRAGFVLASRAALADEAWPGLSAHLSSHVARGDGQWASLLITASALLAVVQPLLLVAGLLALAGFARDAERRADAAAADAVRDDARATQAFARYAGSDGARARGAAFRGTIAVLRMLGLASHPSPARRRADFLAAASGR